MFTVLKVVDLVLYIYSYAGHQILFRFHFNQTAVINISPSTILYIPSRL